MAFGVGILIGGTGGVLLAALAAMSRERDNAR